MSLRQIKIDYLPEHDRLLMLASSADGAEYRLWMTRRYVRLLWPAIVKLAEDTSPRIREQANPEARQALLGMEHEQSLSKADFSKPYEQAAPKATPLGTEPILLARVQTGRDASGRSVLGLHPSATQGITLALETVLLHALCRLLQSAVKKSDWDLDLRFPGTDTPLEAEPGKAIN